MNLVERDEELIILGAMLTAATQGNGQVAVISGGVACGKTALMAAFAERATESGCVFLSATASRAERTLPMGVPGQIFRCRRLPLTITKRAAHLLDDRALISMLYQPEPQTVAYVTTRIFEELRSLLLDFAEQTPLVIDINDVHHADVVSLLCLTYFARRMKASRILLVLSECSQLLCADPLLHTEIYHQPNCRRIQLPPLSRCGVATLLAGSLDLPVAHRLAAACHEVSGGIPLLVNALIEDYRTSAKGMPDQLVFGTAFSRAIASFLYRCEPLVMSVARATAVLGDSASVTLTGELMALSGESVTRAINVLSTAGLLDEGGRVRHEAVRLAVLESIPAEDRTAMHRRAAQVLHSHGAAAPVLARHLIAADRIDVPGAAPLLQEAAEQALADDNMGLAVGYLRRAHEQCADARQRATIKATLTRAEWRVDPASAARHLPELIAAVRGGDLGGRDATALIYYLWWHGRTNDASEVLAVLGAPPGGDAALPAGEVAPPGVSAVDFHSIGLWLDNAYLGLTGRVRPKETGRVAAAVVPASMPPHTRARMLAPGRPVGCEERALADAEQILQGCRPDDPTLPPIVVALATLIAADQLNRAAFWCNLLLEEAAARSIPTWLAVAKAIRAMIEVRQGNLAAAESHARSALSLLTPRGWGAAIGGPLAAMLDATTAAGKYEDAEAFLRMSVPEAMFQTPCGLLYLCARGRYYLSTDRPHAAIADFHACGEQMTAWGCDLPALLPWRTEAAQAYLKMGRRAEARELVNEQLARLSLRHPRTRGISLRVLALTGQPSKRLALLVEAAELLRESGDQLELAHAYADLSQAHLGLGDHTRARMTAQRARRLADECGAEPLKRALPCPGGNTTPCPGGNTTPCPGGNTTPCPGGNTTPCPGGNTTYDSPSETDWFEDLSEAERRVAVLAARGHSNRQIAAKLHVTVSTVEQHLTRVYRKLGVNRRTGLPPELLLSGREVAASGD